MKKQTDIAYQWLHFYGVKLFPHQQTLPSGSDPYAVQIMNSDGEEFISTEERLVELHMVERFGIGGKKLGERARWRPLVIVNGHDDIISEKEFVSMKDAAVHFYRELISMRANCFVDPEHMDLPVEDPRSSSFIPIQKCSSLRDSQMPEVEVVEKLAGGTKLEHKS